MSQTQKSPAPVAAGCEAQYQNKHPDYSAIARHLKSNRRRMRAIKALLAGPVDRPHLDKVIGTTNAPEYIRQLKRLGLSFEMERINCRDRDTMRTWYGRYHLDMADREGLRHALAMQGGK